MLLVMLNKILKKFSIVHLVTKWNLTELIGNTTTSKKELLTVKTIPKISKTNLDLEATDTKLKNTISKGVIYHNRLKEAWQF